MHSTAIGELQVQAMIKTALNALRYRKNRRFYDCIRANVLEIEQFDALPAAEKARVQREKLQGLLRHASRACAFYAGQLQGLDRFDDFDLRSLPILTKEIIRRHPEALRGLPDAPEVRRNTSGGTTGEPVSIYQCEDYSHWNHAYVKFSYQKLSGVPYARCKVAKLWGSERDILEGGEGIRTRIAHYLDNLVLLNSFRMTDAKMQHYAEVIGSFRPFILEAYAQSVYEFSAFILDKGLKMSVPVIMSSAGTLDSRMEQVIGKAFPGARIVNRYGSREVGGIACSCQGADFLHVAMLSHLVEVVDAEGRAVPDGTPGNILVTSLTNFAMPLLRYDIGDRGVLRRGALCPKCGWQGDLLERITGRTVDVFKGKDGALVDGEFFTHLFYFRDWVKKFQVIQQTLDRVQINVVLTAGFPAVPAKDRAAIEDAVRKVLPDVEVRWSLVEDLVYDKSGKIRFTISNI